MDYCTHDVKAWLLSRDGIVIPVYKHPNPKYQFDELLLLAKEYGDETVKKLIKEYEHSHSELLQARITSYYRQNWCKIRVWGTFNEEVTFRICPDSPDWYAVIVAFLQARPMFKQSIITVETDSQYTDKYTFLDRITYDYAVDQKNAANLANMLIKTGDVK